MSDKHDRLLLWQLIGIGAFNIVDYILTLEFLEKGFYEANPIIASTIGTYEFLLIKVFLVPLLLLTLWRHNTIGNKITKLYWIPFVSYYSLMVYYWFLIVTFY